MKYSHIQVKCIYESLFMNVEIYVSIYERLRIL